MANDMTINTEIISSLVLNGDISRLDPKQRIQYYTSLCNNLGIDPLTQPFSIIKLQGKETLYANKNCTQQLAKVYKIGLEILKNERIEDIYVVTVRATDGKRFTDEIGAVTIGSMKGDGLANALMKASTKAKRRAVLAFCGLGVLDETELDTIKGVVKQEIDISTEEKAIEHLDQIQEINNDKEIDELIEAGKKAFDSKKFLMAWIENNYKTRDIQKLTKEQINKITGILRDIVISKENTTEKEVKNEIS